MTSIFEKDFKIAYYYLNNLTDKVKRVGEGWGYCG